MPVRLKKRRIYSNEVGTPEERSASRTRSKGSAGNIKRFIKARLIGNPLTHNGRIKRECKNLADEIAYRLLADARKGRYAAIQLLVDCSEGDFLRQQTINFYLDKIYNIIEKYVKDEEIMFQIGREFYAMKHRRVNHLAPVPPPYPGPEALDPNYSAFPEVQARIDEHNTQPLNLALVPSSTRVLVKIPNAKGRKTRTILRS